MQGYGCVPAAATQAADSAKVAAKPAEKVQTQGMVAPDTQVKSLDGSQAGAKGADGKPIGEITSSVYSFALGRALCLGYARAEAATASMVIQTPLGLVKAREIELPLQLRSGLD